MCILYLSIKNYFGALGRHSLSVDKCCTNVNILPTRLSIDYRWEREVVRPAAQALTFYDRIRRKIRQSMTRVRAILSFFHCGGTADPIDRQVETERREVRSWLRFASDA